MIQITHLPCNFDHNGECLVCDCPPSECAWLRYQNQDYTYETKEQLEAMFKPYVADKENLVTLDVVSWLLKFKGL